MFQIVMEYCDGGPLSQYVAKNEMPAVLIQKWSQQLLDVLVYLHERRFIHRNINGANIILSSPDANSCNLKLTDLGDVKRIVSEVTQANEVPNEKGTHQFMSPEMVMNHRGNVGRCTDIWSLGCVVIQMVTGRAPRFFRGKTELLENQCIMFFIASGEPPALPSGLPDLMQRFIERCLISKVEDRPYAATLAMDPFLKSSDTTDWNMPNRKDHWKVYEQP
ncbi:uncharacterized protein LOC129599328 [Paramacrobiotus metropolitanus]|uniref:uncharacterized protein LOC129599328 n=1 Tax=Paramacrobiotus metropolitanus TaxID=2943436 RepID=UPI0024456229|nr:uncharacterized protein LOC129599328 [Paramacrobiotus metropolitanus]